MKLTEALEILKGVKSRKGEVLTCFLATGVNPLHLNTFGGRTCPDFRR
jgi:hypothetical protein